MWIVGWIFLSILVGVFAFSKERNGIRWFFLSLIISPLITFIILLAVDPSASTLKKCPKCAEEVKIEVLILSFCGYDFEEEEKKKMEIYHSTIDGRGFI
jgi:biotin transporter BioY